MRKATCIQTSPPYMDLFSYLRGGLYRQVWLNSDTVRYPIMLISWGVGFIGQMARHRNGTHFIINVILFQNYITTTHSHRFLFFSKSIEFPETWYSKNGKWIWKEKKMDYNTKDLLCDKSACEKEAMRIGETWRWNYCYERRKGCLTYDRSCPVSYHNTSCRIVMTAIIAK